MHVCLSTMHHGHSTKALIGRMGKSCIASGVLFGHYMELFMAEAAAAGLQIPKGMEDTLCRAFILAVSRMEHGQQDSVQEKLYATGKH